MTETASVMDERKITARVSTIEDYRWWQCSGLDWDWFINKDRSENARMMAGTALHDALEHATAGDTEELRSGDFIFVFKCDALIAMPKIRELRLSMQYGDLTVTGKCDSLSGKHITDYKLILDHQIEGEQYMDSYQWRFYLDMFRADVFDYLVFEGHEEPGEGDRIITIRDIHKITQFRYPDLHRDCANLAAEFLSAVEQQPDLRKIVTDGLEDILAKDHQVERVNSR